MFNLNVNQFKIRIPKKNINMHNYRLQFSEQRKKKWKHMKKKMWKKIEESLGKKMM